MWTHAHEIIFPHYVPQFMFNSQPGDVFGCVADLGWMAGLTCVVYGPLCNGETSVLFEGQPWKPNPGLF